MNYRDVFVALAPATALAIAMGVGGCSRQDPPAGVAQTEGAADRSNRTSADGGGDGPTAFSPADKASAAAMSGSAAASTVYSSQAAGTSAMPTSAPVPSQGRTNAAGGTGHR